MNRILSILLTVVLLFLLAFTAFAVPSGDVTEEAESRYHSSVEQDEEGDFSFLQ